MEMELIRNWNAKVAEKVNFEYLMMGELHGQFKAVNNMPNSVIRYEKLLLEVLSCWTRH